METDRDAKRAQILVAVWRVVASRGLGAVSVRSVAAEAGVSAGRVQHYFATKDELVRASVSFMIDAAESMHDDATKAASPVERLWAVLAHAIPRASTSRAGTSVFYSFVAAAVADPVIAATLADAKTGVEQEVSRLLREVNPALDAPDEHARNLLALSDGLTMRVLIGSLTAEEAARSLRAALTEVSIDVR
ncbi:MAG: TetR family transcriptional regulator C-terminal domain-containing protein [Dermatophilus congolensis]|nr:TetR family transcriptional regulator C-terminal domain-containing protein [Dermatophilus congolensis]